MIERVGDARRARRPVVEIPLVAGGERGAGAAAEIGAGEAAADRRDRKDPAAPAVAGAAAGVAAAVAAVAPPAAAAAGGRGVGLDARASKAGGDADRQNTYRQ